MQKAIIAIFIYGLAHVCQAETVSLTLGWTVTGEFGSAQGEVSKPSQIITLSPGQTANILHFNCFELESRDRIPNGPHAPSGQKFSDRGWIEVVINGLTINYSWKFAGFANGVDFTQNPFTAAGMPTIVGPATIKLNANLVREASSGSSIDPGGCICTLEINGPATTNQPLKPTEVVVEPDNEGPVEVIVESSIDTKQTWQPTAPGIFGTSDQKRFFRLRTIKR
jgi:hypothetical protein